VCAELSVTPFTRIRCTVNCYGACVSQKFGHIVNDQVAYIATQGIMSELLRIE